MTYYILRGSAWDDSPWYCRSAHHDRYPLDNASLDISLRVVLPR